MLNKIYHSLIRIEVPRSIKTLTYILIFLATIFIPIYLVFLEHYTIAFIALVLGIYGVIESLEWQ